MKLRTGLLAIFAFMAGSCSAQLIWRVGADDNAWPVGDGGGSNTSFVQENGAINPLPGNPAGKEVPFGADNDYYFAGEYTTVNPAVNAVYGDYVPVGIVDSNEEAAERSFAGADNELRYHFNVPATLKPSDRLTVTFDALLLDESAPDSRYGIEVYVNGVLVQPELIIRPTNLNQAITTASFTPGQANLQGGPGFDNIVSLRGINYNSQGGGNWMGFDYVQLAQVIPPAVLPWAVGADDNDWPAGNGGGTNTSFVQENGTINLLPGSPHSAEVPQGADNDYYFAGSYTTVIAGNGMYTPVGLVSQNEEAAERAFAAADNALRYHFNLPATLQPSALLTVTFDAVELDVAGATNQEPRYGIEVYCNGVLVQPEILIRPGQLDVDFKTPPFTLASVGARAGPGIDNIITLKGINYNSQGGGNWMGIDYVRLDQIPPPPVFPWAVGSDDNGWPEGNGGGANTSFVQENALINSLPGSPFSVEAPQGADNDYYFAGSYTTVIIGNGFYTPAGAVMDNEEAAERGFAAADNALRYHFNLPAELQLTNLLTVTFDSLGLDSPSLVNLDPRYGIEIYFNGVLVQPEILVRQGQLDVDFTSPPFTLASVGAKTGPGFDNIITLRGINYNSQGGGNWMGIDYVRLDPFTPLKFLSQVVSGGQITLKWTGTGQLEWSPNLLPPWTAITPAPTSPYTEPIAPEGRRYYRLRK